MQKNTIFDSIFVITSAYRFIIAYRRLITKCEPMFYQVALCEETTAISATSSEEAI